MMRNRLLHTLVVALVVFQFSCNKNNVTDNSDKNPFFEEIKIEKSDFRKIGDSYKYARLSYKIFFSLKKSIN
jgi:hypothetical protein